MAIKSPKMSFFGLKLLFLKSTSCQLSNDAIFIVQVLKLNAMSGSEKRGVNGVHGFTFHM